jgi:hypothetical protein
VIDRTPASRIRYTPVKRILTKLDLPERVQAVTFAYGTGWPRPDA